MFTSCSRPLSGWWGYIILKNKIFHLNKLFYRLNPGIRFFFWTSRDLRTSDSDGGWMICLDVAGSLPLWMCHYSSISYIFVHLMHHVSLPGRDLEIGRFILVEMRRSLVSSVCQVFVYSDGSGFQRDRAVFLIGAGEMVSYMEMLLDFVFYLGIHQIISNMLKKMKWILYL